MRPDTAVNERRNTSAEVNCCNVKTPQTRVLLGLLAIGMIASGASRAFGQQGLQVVPSPFINNSSLSGAAMMLGASNKPTEPCNNPQECRSDMGADAGTKLSLLNSEHAA